MHWRPKQKKTFYSITLSDSISKIMSSYFSVWDYYHVIVGDNFEGRIAEQVFYFPYIVVESMFVVESNDVYNLDVDPNSKNCLVLIKSSPRQMFGNTIRAVFMKLLKKHANLLDADADEVSLNFVQSLGNRIFDEEPSRNELKSMQEKSYRFWSDAIIQWDDNVSGSDMVIPIVLPPEITPQISPDEQDDIRPHSIRDYRYPCKSELKNASEVLKIRPQSVILELPSDPLSSQSPQYESSWTQVLAEFFVHRYIEGVLRSSYSPGRCWVSPSRDICLQQRDTWSPSSNRLGFNFEVEDLHGALFGIKGKLFVCVKGKGSLYSGRFYISEYEFQKMDAVRSEDFQESAREKRYDKDRIKSHYIVVIVDNIQLLEVSQTLWNSLLNSQLIERGCHMFVRTHSQMVITHNFCKHPRPIQFEIRDRKDLRNP